MVIAQGKLSQALEVLAVKVLGRFVDIFLTVPHSKLSKCVILSKLFVLFVVV